MAEGFVHLKVHTEFSLHDGIVKVKPANKPFHIANNLITHDQSPRMTDESLAQIADIVDQVGPVHGIHHN